MSKRKEINSKNSQKKSLPTCVHDACAPAPLGINTKFVSPLDNLGSDLPPEEYVNWLRARYSLLYGARDLLLKYQVKRRGNSKSLHRTIGCHYWLIDQFSMVDCVSVQDRIAAYFGNLMKCGSVWSCPVCAAKISERRRLELQQALDNATALGLGYALGTYTIQHKEQESCKVVLDGLDKAYRAFFAGKTGIRLRENFGIVGQIRGLEVTYGLNGWHCHKHPIFVFKSPPSPNLISELRTAYSERWQKVCARYERYAHAKYGFHITNSDRLVADYVAKFGGDGVKEARWIEQARSYEQANWTEAHELTKAVVKSTVMNSSRTPNGLILDYILGDEVAGQKWIEYVQAFTGKQQLLYSPGLKKRLLVDVKTDEDIAGEKDLVGDILAQLTREQWDKVLKFDLRGDLQAAVATGDVWQVLDVLESFDIFGVYYPDLVHDPNYYGPYRVYGEENQQCD